MITRCLMAAAVAVSLSVSSGAGPAAAETCGGVYRVKSGDSLSLIADGLYKDASKWTAIHQSNIADIGQNPNRIRVGQELRLACIDGLPVGLEGGTTAAQAAAISTQNAARPTAPVVPATQRALRLLTGDDYAPFTDRSLPNGGLYTDVVDAAMRNNPTGAGYKIYWVNDWAAHLDTLIYDGVVDMGFPWIRPDCDQLPDNWRCNHLVFSEPMFEILVLLFVDKSRPFTFATDNNVNGNRLCRPKGYSKHVFDQNGRNWLKDGKMELVSPLTVANCFEMLVAGEVDAVAMNEFTGRAAVADLDLRDRVDVDATPLTIDGLHVVISKEHPQSGELLALVNDSLKTIKGSGEYQQIIDTHMSRIWEGF
ncbi:MAG: transporter substrate-binding domain-containing protein [Pseudomonadota bacterium]